MEPIEIKVTPHKIERVVLLAIIVLLLFSLYYYGYAMCGVSGKDDAPKAANKTVNTTPAVTEQVVKKAEPAKEAPKPSSASGASDGKLTLSVSDPRYRKDDSASKPKWVIDAIELSVKNGKDSAQTGLTVDMYVTYAAMEIEEKNLRLSKPWDTFVLEPVAAGSTLPKNFPLSKKVNMWEPDGSYTLKFVLKQKSEVISEISKTVSPK